jgi:predicted amidophosphoribosyltransferase
VRVRVLSNAHAPSFDCAATRDVRRMLRAGVLHAARIARGALPQRCELCVAPTGGGLLCAPCAAGLPRIFAACPVCALPSDGGVCGACVAHPPPFAATVAALVYAFPTDRLMQRIKYGGRLALAEWAGSLLAAAVGPVLDRRAPGDRPERIVALPLAPARQRERGFNQAREIAACVARATALPLAAPLGFNQAREIAACVARATALPLAAPLARTIAGPPQAALPWAERRRNVRGAFTVQGDVRGARIALVDDVMTTGATLAEASASLIRAGAARVDCWVVARTLPPDAR